MCKIGERGSGFRPKAGEIQDFEVLRDQCVQRGALFEDPDFCPVDSSLFYSKSPDKSFEWLRPSVSFSSLLLLFLYKPISYEECFSYVRRKSRATLSYLSKELQDSTYNKENWVI